MKGVSVVPIRSWAWWLVGGRKETEPVSNGSDALKFPTKISSSKAKVGRRWIGKDEIRKEVDHVTVSLSGSETDGPEWSVGWTEPHGSDFKSNDEEDDGFLVLVPCYRAVVEGSSNLPNGISPGGKNYMEQWLSTLQNL